MDPVTRKVHVRVPATSANLGSGFDTVGLALDYHDELEFTLSSDPLNMAAQILITGEGENTLPRDESHLVVSTFRRACSRFGLSKCGFIMEAHNNIPQARGMGSSAEAIVAGISAAYAFSHEGELDRDLIFQYAADLEGHPDNVAPAVYGGMTVSWTEDGQSEIVQGEVVNTGFRSVNYLVDAGVRASIFVPDYELSTAQARAALLNTVPFADAVFNMSRMGLLIGAMNPSALAGEQDPNELLFTATQDKLHQSYRAPLMKPSAELIDLLREHGYAAAVSGAGPCVCVLHNGDVSDELNQIAAAQLASGHWRVLHLNVDTQGVQVARL
ncbi:homoserine kinase [Bifidobacterium animalis]|uniref:Homoserine kinase n=1 Tax=Bifidobacterium animalis subsp. lactis TaxID=302911 RepID=A0A8B3RGX2_BIFAN|nr:homoserine kinase [Bifidobacterium animalis]RYM92986.1 homoserine kinase [Bifidobacterium animalis subsp. lactis]